MKEKPSKNQAGFALLLFVLALMTMGGLILIGFSEGMLEAAEAKKFEHNKRVLEEAKQALLQSAYNYPTTNDLGPGRLPCADTDNDGVADCGSTFGRLPWAQANLNLYDIRDADGERLWYAVSSSFRPQAAIINSDTSGTLTLRDQGGNVIYDGSNPGGLTQYGVAAVIIAPGAITARNGVPQDRSVANVNDPDHYLDLVVGTEDNATVTHSSATDGFILGPVDSASTDAVNDQFIVITAAEVAEVAEQATLQAYRGAIDQYMVDTGGVYPWLYNYNVATYAELSSQYTAWDSFNDEKTNELTLGAGGNIGRIPSIFGVYFTELTTSSTGFETEIQVKFDNVDILGAIKYNRTFPSVAIGNLFFVNTIWDLSPATVYNFPGFDAKPNEPVVDFRFVDVADVMGADVDLIATFTQDQTYTTAPVWFWDDKGLEETGDWRKCAGGGDDITDCHVDPVHLPDPQGPGDHNIKVMKLVFTLTFDSSVADQYQITLDTDSMEPTFPKFKVPTSGRHAIIEVKYKGPAFLTPMLVVDYEIDNDYLNGGMGSYTVTESGTLDYTTIANSKIKLEVRYYPVLPAWACTNTWHDSMLMAYAEDYRPGLSGPCTEGTDCIEVLLLPGERDLNKIAVLINTGEHDWVDDGAPGFDDDYADVFDSGNDDLDRILNWRIQGGNDNLLILDELP